MWSVHPIRFPNAGKVIVRIDTVADRGDAIVERLAVHSSAANSGIHVLPNWHTSGVASPANAVSSFSWAAFQGICCTRTRCPGSARSNSRTNVLDLLAFRADRPEVDNGLRLVDLAEAATGK